MEIKSKRNKSSLKFFFLGLVVFGLLIIPALQAGNHPKSKYEWDASKQTGYFDLVVSLDWNPDQTERDVKLKSAFETFAKTVYDMSEGKHKIRNLCVYVKTTEGEQETGSCDIYIKNSAGRANATVNYFGQSGGRINMFTSFKGKKSEITLSAKDIGQTLGHEFGHYVYGLYDEYIEEDKSCLFTFLFPSKPCENDTECDTIMNRQWEWQDFCTKKNHMRPEAKPKDPTNAQHRMHQVSGWETLVRNPKDDPIPFLYRFFPKRTQYTHLVYPEDGTKQEQTGGEYELEINYIEEGSNHVVLIIDKSGSMDSDNKIVQAKSAAKQFVDLLQIGDNVAVVAFSGGVSIIKGMTEITDASSQTNIKSAIDSITADGSTAMGDGMRTALTILLDNTASCFRRSAVLLGNGWHNAGAEHPLAVTPDYASNNIPIYTIGLGAGADQALMSQIAADTGGSFYFSYSAAELQAIYAAISQESTSAEQLVNSSSEILSESEVVEYEVTADSSMANFTCLTSWAQGDTMRLEMIRPDGQVISPANVDNFPDISYSAESTYALYRIRNPTTGIWKVITTAETVTDTGEINRQIQAATDIHLSLGVSETTVSYPSPIGISASLRKSLYVAEATVTATITAPDGSKTSMMLRDDGQSPDFRPEDGFYSGAFTDYSQDGEYEIVVTATNPNLDAAETDAGALEMGGTDTWDLIGEDFLRSDKTTVTISGVMQDDHGDTPAEATHIESDKTPVPGKIEQSGDLDFFTFDAMANETYSIRTSQLIDPMDSVIILCDQNGSPIQDDDNGGGGASSLILWTAPGDGAYYVSVEGGGTTGNYQLTVGPKQLWESPETPTDEPPTVSIVTPADGASVSGIVTIEAEADDDVGVKVVEFYIDNIRVYTDDSKPYTYSWDTSLYSYGSHTIKVKAYDTALQRAVDRVNATVDNLPTVTITTPQNGATVFGTVNVQAEASDDSGIQKVEFYIDGSLKATGTTMPYAFTWSTLTYSNGPHKIKATAYDTGGGQVSTEIDVTVQNVVLGVQAERLEERAWMIKKDFGQINLSVENTGNVPVQRYVLYRREAGNTYRAIKEIAPSELQSGSYTYVDKYLDRNISYTYKLAAYIPGGEEVGVSNEQTI